MRRPKFDQAIPRRDLLEKPEQDHIESGSFQLLQPLIQVFIQLLVEVSFHPGDQGPKLMDDSIQLADRIFRDRSETSHVVRLQFLDCDIDEGKIGQDGPRRRESAEANAFICCHARVWTNCDRRRRCGPR